MKQVLVTVLIIIQLLLLTACILDNETATVKDGTYILDYSGIDEVLLPNVKISEGKLIFSYNLLSSYLNIGSYTIKDDVLTMVTDDGQYTYEFLIDGDTLIFQKKESSEIRTPGGGVGVEIEDQAEFILDNETEE